MRIHFDALVSLIYPEFCRACGHLVENYSDGAACRICWDLVHFFTTTNPLCVKCGLLLIDGRLGDEVRCGQCESHAYDKARAAGLYEAALSATVLNLKHTAHVPGTARTAIVAAFSLLPPEKDRLIIPVPLSRKRLNERGFNQASLLARVVSRKTGLPLDEFSLVRIRDTPFHRSAMDRKAREISVKGAFAVIRPGLVKDRSILLIDDVMTSGSTVSHCALALKKNGAARVDVLTLARASR